MASLSELMALHEYKYGRNRGLQQVKDQEAIRSSQSRTKQNDRRLEQADRSLGQADERLKLSERGADQTDTRIKQIDRQMGQSDEKIAQAKEQFDFLKTKYEDSKEGAKLDVYTKILEINEKINKLEKDEQQWGIAKNILKAKGIIPMDEGEETAARNVAIADAEANSPDNASSSRTESGKLNDLIKNVKVSGDIFDPKFSYKDDTKDDQKPVDRVRIRTMAENMAKEAKSAEMQMQAGSKGMGIMEIEALKAYVPTMDEIQKFMPQAEQYLYGETAQYSIKKETPTPTDKPKKEKKNSPDGIDDLDGVDGLMDIINTL